MKTKKEYIDIIAKHAEKLRSDFGIKTLRLFGSVSRDEHNSDSDVDVCVEMEPHIFLLVRLRRFLEEILGCPVDVVRMHKNMNPYLLKQIENDGVYIIR